MSDLQRLVLAGLVAAVLLVALRALLRADYSKPNLEVFTEMAYSVAGESFAPAPALPGGRVLQDLAEGVVIRGHRPFPYGEGEEEAQRAGEELASPIEPGDPGAAERGAKLYATYCVVCHDAAGDGLGPVVLRGMVPPPSLHGASALDMKDGQMFHILTRGRGNMASYAAQLTEEERWLVITHVRRLQEQP